MIILGIDPGSAVTGIGVVEFDGKNLRPLGFQAIRTPASARLPLRLKQIYDEVAEAIRRFQPQVVCIEQVFGGKNIQSALTIGQARGAALMAAVNSGIEIAEYSPAEIKKSLSGRGGASKEQVQFMVRNILGMKENPAPLDCSDALAAAICHAHKIRK